MSGAGFLGAILLCLLSGGPLGGAAFRSSDDLSPERPGPPPLGRDVYRADGPLPRRVREAGGGPPDWDSAAAAAWWMTSGADRLDLSESCRQLLRGFARSGAALIGCVARNARPVRVCEECIPQFHSLGEAFSNISENSGNISCSKQLLSSDRLQIVLNMYNYLHSIWTDSVCDACLNSNGTAPSVDTVIFRKMLNDSLNCFDRYSKYPDHGNRSDLCIKCKTSYNNLTKWYNKMADTQPIMCIDIVDAMNLTRQLWSKTYNCTVPCSDTVPVIAVSTFLLFLPVIFYLSTYLHSEQKKMKLMEPKRLKPCSSAAHIEDRSS
ncbi:osteopetrosis-associated transmembrane protein 1 isoform X1 [Scyliorhinus torazame]